MPKLQQPQLKEFILPSTKDLAAEEQVRVLMDVSPKKAGDIVGFNSGMSHWETGLIMLTNRLKSWSYTDEADKQLPITLETVGLLKMDDFTFLVDLIPTKENEGFTNEQKKTSSATSEPSPAVSPPETLPPSQ